jgi:glycerate 2-kinase
MAFPSLPTGRSENPGHLEMRRQARAIFDHALAECSIAKAFAGRLRVDGGQLIVGDERFELSNFARLAVVSIGKAGHSTAEALSNIIPTELSGIVACPEAPATLVPGLRYFYGGHPLPNEESLQAGSAVLEYLRGLSERSLVLFLLSGGASAIAECPISRNLTLSDMRDTYQALVHSGAPIAEINAVRKHLSATKGGRMAQAATPATQLSVLVSDVPDNALDALASGPTIPDNSTVEDCHTIVQRHGMLLHFPDRVRAIFAGGQLEETPKPGDPAFRHSLFVTALSNRDAVNAAADYAKQRGFRIEIDNQCDDWDYVKAANYLLSRLCELRQAGSPVCLISGGEVTVRVGEKSGTGGRNQQFALYCAGQIAGEAITVLSAGTDGIDGNSPAAGAVVDGSTLSRTTERGLDIAATVSGFDAFPLLESIGDAIITGPTGSNVRDLRILLAY